MNKTRFKGRGEGTIAAILFAAHLLTAAPMTYAATTEDDVADKVKITESLKVNPTTVDVLLNNSQRMTFDFYGENIFRIFQDNKGGLIRDPEAKHEAAILVDSPRKAVKLTVKENKKEVIMKTSKVRIVLNKETTLFRVFHLKTGKPVIELMKPIEFNDKSVKLTLKERAKEYFYGGGVQNGRFSHKGQIIAIENQNSWTDGGVASPTPFYWSTEGYGMMWYTFKKGTYNFGTEQSGLVEISHQENYLDLFFMVNDGAVPILNDFYQLTGKPAFMPKFGFYQGHLNAYNRDYWTETEEGGILYEDGKRYKESQAATETGLRETLNGENGAYQFSARAVIDRYAAHDMPLGWLLPNDGYGAGYGQTDTLDGNIQNLRNLSDYAHKKGVEIGLWTQSELHPKEGVETLLQRDIVKEVRDAGVRVLKTDVAWVGAGYSFGLNGVSDVSKVMQYYGNNARPFIISLDGWAGTQRHAGIWTGDQSGGQWEYIRFHIPTYIGSGLSGQPNISSDMDGIFGGKQAAVNTRDFQWKTFTPQQLNMDGWGANEKYPHALGEPVASINRMYLKLRSSLIPYIYSVAHQSINGMPIVRAMFLEYPNAYTMGKATQYQFLCGPNFLVAPIYQDTASDEAGNDIRDGIYLPEGEWVDYFTGQIYKGGVVINNFDAPLWKLPVFVKNGAIIPMTNPNNNLAQIDKKYRRYEFYPRGKSAFTEYDDDGISMQYQNGTGVSTLIESDVIDANIATISIHPSKGRFKGYVPTKRTELIINVTKQAQAITATIAGKKVELKQAKSLDEYKASENVYFYNAAPNLNQFATAGSEFAKTEMTKNPQIWVKLAELNVKVASCSLSIEGFEFAPENNRLISGGSLTAPAKACVTEENTQAYTLTPTWDKLDNADYYEIMFDGQVYSTIKNTSFLFNDLKAATDYSFKLRAVNKDTTSAWVAINAKTKANPLKFAITGITASCSVPGQASQTTANLFDFDEKSLWHTDYHTKAETFEMIVDLNTINQIEKLHYIPREDRGNGTILEGTISYSDDKKTWSDVTPFTWAQDGSMKVLEFANKPTVRYLKINVTKNVGNFGSGYEMYIFKVPGTTSFIPGDINSDGKLDNNDMTSYGNYTGLRLGDSDFEGYVSIGDGNKNNLIDAYDISQVASKLSGDGSQGDTKLDGSFTMTADKQAYKAGEEITLTIKAEDMKDVNALSFALPYDPDSYEYVSIKPQGMNEMKNMTNDRLHTNGVKALYPTFINVGDKPIISGNGVLFTITFKAKKDIQIDLQMKDAMIVDKNLNTKEF